MPNFTVAPLATGRRRSRRRRRRRAGWRRRRRGRSAPARAARSAARRPWWSSADAGDGAGTETSGTRRPPGDTESNRDAQHVTAATGSSTLSRSVIQHQFKHFQTQILVGSLTFACDGGHSCACRLPCPRSPSAATTTPSSGPPTVHVEDVALMREAGVDLVTLGVFSWAWLEPRAGALGLRLARRADGRPARGAGISVDLATATASPPPWLTHRAPGDAAGDPGRRARCGPAAGRPSARARRSSASTPWRCAARWPSATRDHPALALWHVSNELGCHNARCYCDVSAAAFRTGCAAGTTTSTRSTTRGAPRSGPSATTTSSEVLPPRVAPTFRQPHPAAGLPRGSPPTSCSTTSWPSATCCTELSPACR